MHCKPFALFPTTAVLTSEGAMPRPVPVLACTASEVHLALARPLPRAAEVHVSLIHEGEMIAGPARVASSEGGRTVLRLRCDPRSGPFTAASLLTAMSSDVRLHEC